MQHNHPATEGQNVLIKQILTDLRELRREYREDRMELWSALNDLRESITGNSYVEQLIM